MKQITITLPDADAGKFVSQLLDLNVTFTVTTTVSRDPLVYAALETPRLDEVRVAHAPPDPDHEPDPVKVEAGLKGREVGVPSFVDRRKRHVQRLTPDGRTSMQVVEAKIAQIGGRRFQLKEITNLAQYSGFQPDTLKNQLQILVARGRVLALGKTLRQEIPSKGVRRESPLPPSSQEELPLEAHSASAASPDEPAEFVSGEGWREPVQ